MDAHGEYAKKVRNELLKHGFRTEVDLRNERMDYKIREFQTQKVPYTLVLGDDEMNSSAVNVRPYGTEKQEPMGLGRFIDELQTDAGSYSREE